MLRFAEDAGERYDFRLLVGHLLDSALQTAADEQIVYRDLKTITYREFRQRIGRLASLLSSCGVGQGDAVAVMDWDSHRYLECYFGVPMMGAVLHTVNVRVPLADIAYALNRTGAQALLVHSDFAELVDEIRERCPGIKTIISMQDTPGRSAHAEAIGDYEDLLQQADPDFAFESFDENAIATTFFTSGTTGRPKQVSFSHRQIVLLALSIAGSSATRRRAFGRDDVYMPLTPMFHVHAWCFPYVATMLGTKQVYPGRYEAETICRLRRDHHTSFSHCVPTVLRLLIDGARQTATDLADWAIIIGGSALSSALFDEGTALGLEISAGFGMSETGPVTTLAKLPRREDCTADEARETLTKAGSPIALVTIEVVDEDMRPVPHDGKTRGELVLRSPWLTAGYVGDVPASAELWRGGWLHTQDIATIDARGQLTIRDRQKDIIKSGGEWVDSIELESLVVTVEGVVEVAVIGVADARWGERPIAVVVCAAGIDLALADINRPIREAIASGTLSRYALLDRIELVSALPRTGIGKIDKKALRTTFA